MLRTRAVVLIVAYLITFASAQTPVIDATSTFVKSTESEYDHEVTLGEGLTFHWNDIVGNTVELRLIHKASSLEGAPSWLAVGFYGGEATPTDNPSQGSDAVIGIVDEGSVKKYSDAFSSNVAPMEPQTLLESSIKRHDSDDGTVTTVLSFEKLLEESDVEEIRLHKVGENAFVWAVGLPSDSSLDKYQSIGFVKLDLDKVRAIAESGGGEIGGTGAATDDKNIAQVVTADCTSKLVGPDGVAYDRQLQLTKLLSFHWRLSDTDTLVGALQYSGAAWLAFGVSMDGKSIGSEAIIGLPGENAVKKYELIDNGEGKVLDVPPDGLFKGMVSSDGDTVLSFEAKLESGSTHKILKTGLNSFLYAEGSSIEFGYPQHRGIFRTDLESCEGGKLPARSHMGAFAAHGVIATLAWGIASPFAVTVAWFRTLVPSSWIYIHVFSNVISFFFTLIAVIVAISAMSVQTRASHFSDPHHWIGLLLLVAVTFQVMNGFLRPPVEKKNDPYAASHYDIDPGFIKMPKTPRQVWVFSHRLTGIVTIAMGIFQIQSGLNAFARNYSVESIAPWFWGYVGLFAFCLISLKFWIMFEEYKARRGMEAMHVDHRSNAGSSQGMSHAESELVPVQFDMS